MKKIFYLGLLLFPLIVGVASSDDIPEGGIVGTYAGIEEESFGDGCGGAIERRYMLLDGGDTRIRLTNYLPEIQGDLEVGAKIRVRRITIQPGCPLDPPETKTIVEVLER